MQVTRLWHMPNKYIFSTKPVRELLEKEVKGFSIDPFGAFSEIATLTNDIDHTTLGFLSHDALEFLHQQTSNEVDTVLFDPPYSPRQVSECYKKAGIKIDNLKTSAKFWADIKDQIARVTKLGGKVISFGWNSNGIGMCRRFKIEKILIIAHGGYHNDTIITIEKKIEESKFQTPEPDKPFRDKNGWQEFMESMKICVKCLRHKEQHKESTSILLCNCNTHL